MAYFKWDKETGATIAAEIQQAATDLQSIIESIDHFVQECDGKPDNLKGWEKEVKEDGGWFWKLLWDWTGDYDDFMRRLGKVQEKNNTMKNGGKVKLDNLSNALNEMQVLIETFDDPNTFSLANAYQGKENVEIAYNAEGVEVIVYTAPDGTRYTMSEMLNAFYTYSGMSMNGQLQGYLFAQENGIEFDAAYQSNILAGVNSTVGDIHAAGGFGVASADDIYNVNAELSKDPGYISYVQHDGNGKLLGNTGGSWYSNMQVGSDFLNQYTIADFITNPNHAVEQGLIAPPEEEGIQEMSEDGDQQSDGLTDENVTDNQGQTGATGTGDPSSNDGGGGGGMPNGRDETNTDNKQESNPNGENGENGGDSKGNDENTGSNGVQEEWKDIDVNELKHEEHIDGDIQTEIKENYDELARDKYENMDPEEAVARREGVINETQTMIDNNDTDGLRNKLADYGYSESDIDKIVNDPDALISAMVEGDQRQQMAEYAKEYAEQDGVKNYDTSYDDGQSYKDLKDGSSSALTANRNNDPVVKESRDNYLDAKDEYKKATDNVNDAADKVNENLDTVNEYKDKLGEDKTKWTKENVEGYQNAVKDYKDSVNDYHDKHAKYEEAKDNYNKAYDDYETAKQDFDNRIKNNAAEENDRIDGENAKNAEQNVDVSDDALLGETEFDPNGDKNTVAENQGIALADASSDSGTPASTASGTGSDQVNVGYVEQKVYPGTPKTADEVLLQEAQETVQTYPGTPQTLETVQDAYPGPGSEIEMKTAEVISGTPAPGGEVVGPISTEPQRLPGTPAPGGEIVGPISTEPQTLPGVPASSGELVAGESVEQPLLNEAVIEEYAEGSGIALSNDVEVISTDENVASFNEVQDELKANNLEEAMSSYGAAKEKYSEAVGSLSSSGQATAVGELQKVDNGPGASFKNIDKADILDRIEQSALGTGISSDGKISVEDAALLNIVSEEESKAIKEEE